MVKLRKCCAVLMLTFGFSQAAFASVIDGIFIFGDSLSDSGAFVGNVDAGAGGKFTTNPGPVWTETLGAHYGLSVVANNPNNSNTSATGNNYAQGGAQVTNPIGIGQTASPQSALPISTQVDNYLISSPLASGTGLYTVWGGANDLFYNLGLIGAGAITPTTAGANLFTSASSLVGQAQRLVDAGAGTVLIPNLPDIGTTPSTIFSAISAVGAGNTNTELQNALVAATLALRTAANTPAEQAAVKVAAIAAAAGVLGVSDVVLQAAVDQTGMLFSGLTAAYNGALTSLLTGLPTNVVLLDVASLFSDVLADPSVYGLANVTGTACNTSSSLSCTAPFFAAETAFFDFLFADAVHPTAEGHALIAGLAITTLNAHFGIPEPSVVILLLLGFFVMVWVKKRMPQHLRVKD
ncbi:MAG: hypothetical protein COB62_02590 [Piscirickettsiaceae bacterium]|nr:MAG: hypothetical protein COB62_02590 [Piscirickettsiaceae bacterium]